MKLPVEGDLVRWEELRMVQKTQADFATHAAACDPCHQALADPKFPSNVVEATANAYTINGEERFCSQGRVYLIEAGKSAQLMMKGAI